MPITLEEPKPSTKLKLEKMKPNYNALKINVLKSLYFNGALSCTELSDNLDKSLPVVAKAVDEMIKDGVLTENGYASSTGGRRPLLYCITPGNNYVIAIATDQLYSIIKILDISNNREAYAKKVELKLLNNPASLSILEELIKEAIKDSGIAYDKFLGIGLGMAGFVNTKVGVNYSYLHTHTGENLTTHLERVFNMPVFIDNDSTTIALAESKFGLAKGRKNVMVVNVGWGIGLGMILDGKIFRGHTGYAGELSHIPVFEGQRICECGKRGCLETEATMRVVVERVIEEIKDGRKCDLTLKDSIEEMCQDVMNAAKRGDQFAIEILSDMAYTMGKAIAILIHINSPELVLLSGRGAEAGRILLAPIQQALNEHCIPRLFEHTEVNISAMKYEAYPLGAAALVMENLSVEHVA